MPMVPVGTGKMTFNVIKIRYFYQRYVVINMQDFINQYVFKKWGVASADDLSTKATPLFAMLPSESENSLHNKEQLQSPVCIVHDFRAEAGLPTSGTKNPC